MSNVKAGLHAHIACSYRPSVPGETSGTQWDSGYYTMCQTSLARSGEVKLWFGRLAYDGQVGCMIPSG